jgi:hypothetical protein
MSPEVQSAVAGIGVALVSFGLGKWIESRIKRPIGRITLPIAAGLGILAFVLWPVPDLVDVPSLGHASQAEAERRLTDLRLIPHAEPRVDATTTVERVVPLSEQPPAGTPVRIGSQVRFAVSVAPPASTDQMLAGRINILSPLGGGEVVLRREADGAFRFDVEGTVDGADMSRHTLQLWVQPITPPSDQPGWYLQRLPANGVRSITGNRWRAIGQLGNQQYPPRDGHIVELAATLLPSAAAQQIEGRPGPTTVATLPGTASNTVRVRVRVR